ncbi:tRNA pseudouridine(55) synthase TruB [Microgenomates group bacterium RIFCSPHIGHO2_01_FULL_45_11]|nr:MAG: tRNA pseudouridine(55) synthase TruB [Microgenomates group bacterium RIFCSPHIGHO2_01_FULL_45_11]
MKLTGVVSIYKPKGLTSHDVVNEVRRLTGERRVGHAGTLDPLASGVLVVGIGREATRKLKEIVGQEKEYLAKIRLGMTSTTDDEEGEKTKLSNYRTIELANIQSVLKNFVGTVEQVPPVYSAVKIKGKEAYKLARKGKVVELRPRQVVIKSIDLVDYSWPFLTIKVVTGPGVYIRSLARDIGEKLYTGGYLTSLKRTRVGRFTLTDCVPIETLAKKLDSSGKI